MLLFEELYMTHCAKITVGQIANSVNVFYHTFTNVLLMNFLFTYKPALNLYTAQETYKGV